MSLAVRTARSEDFDDMMRVYRSAREFMRTHGTPTQWGSSSPAPETVRSDIENRTGYVVEEDGRICGAFALLFGADPMYETIERGAWPNGEPYMTIHRLASDGTARGISQAAFAFAAAHPSRFLAGQTDTTGEPVKALRIDTHAANLPMQAKIRAAGFAYCGIVHTTTDHTERLAFQKEL